MYRKKTQNSPETKNLLEFKSIFLGVLKVKKKIKTNCNPLHHTEPFDTKINRFGGQNLLQWLFSLSKPESNDSLSLSSHQRKTEKRGKPSKVPKYIFLIFKGLIT